MKSLKNQTKIQKKKKSPKKMKTKIFENSINVSVRQSQCERKSGSINDSVRECQCQIMSGSI